MTDIFLESTAMTMPLPFSLATITHYVANDAARSVADASATEFGVVAQVRRAFEPANRLAAMLGFALGGFVPVAIYIVAHREAGALSLSAPWALVFGGLAYSAQTVFKWASLAFQSSLKSVGFCVLLEGVMVTSHTHWLALIALAYLVGINGTATACTLSIGVQNKK